MEDEDSAAGPAEDPTIAEFSRVCDQLQGFDAELDAEFVDGCFTALVVAPRTVLPSAWLPVVFGDAFERAFADPDDVQRAMAALFGRWNQIAGELDPKTLYADPDVLWLRPLVEDPLDETDEEDAGEAAAWPGPGGAWARGFFAVTEAFAGDWRLTPRAKPADADLLAMRLADIAALTLGEAELARHCRAAFGSRVPSRDDLIDEACLAVQDLRLFWLEHTLRPAPRRVVKPPGRNDACPCGSGRKFKKCCGATAP